MRCNPCLNFKSSRKSFQAICFMLYKVNHHCEVKALMRNYIPLKIIYPCHRLMLDGFPVAMKRSTSADALVKRVLQSVSLAFRCSYFECIAGCGWGDGQTERDVYNVPVTTPKPCGFKTTCHDDVIEWRHFLRRQWIPLTKASNAEL